MQFKVGIKKRKTSVWQKMSEIIYIISKVTQYLDRINQLSTFLNTKNI